MTPDIVNGKRQSSEYGSGLLHGNAITRTDFISPNDGVQRFNIADCKATFFGRGD